MCSVSWSRNPLAERIALTTNSDFGAGKVAIHGLPGDTEGACDVGDPQRGSPLDDDRVGGVEDAVDGFLIGRRRIS